MACRRFVVQRGGGGDGPFLLNSSSLLCDIDSDQHASSLPLFLSTPLTHPALPQSMHGTPSFMAPEVIRGEPHGRKADTWSLGCVVIEMASAHPPWSDDSQAHPFALMYKIASTMDLPALPAVLDTDGCDFVRRCLDRNPKSRPFPADLVDHVFLATELPSATARARDTVHAITVGEASEIADMEDCSVLSDGTSEDLDLSSSSSTVHADV